MNANARWQEVISENLASSSIPGFKKQELDFSAVQAGVLAGQPGTQNVVLPHAALATNFNAGELKATGSLTDVAIEGRGFFEVQLPNGAKAFTRDGEFHANAQGQLVTKEGYLVLSDGGAIQFDRNNPSPISISATGEVSQGPDEKGRLRLVDFDSPQSLVAISGGYFLSNQNALPHDVDSPAVRQGFLEGANTSSVAEMANLISAMRTFEANQRVVQMHDDRMSRAISELGNPN